VRASAFTIPKNDGKNAFTPQSGNSRENLYDFSGAAGFLLFCSAFSNGRD